MPTKEELLTVIRKCAVDLIQTHGTTLSDSAIRTRMKRIADDLDQAANE